MSSGKKRMSAKPPERVYEVVFQDRTWAGNVLSRIVKRINTTLPDVRDHLQQNHMSALARGLYARKLHKAASVRILEPETYVLPEGATWIE
jgi:hypothetical protein